MHVAAAGAKAQLSTTVAFPLAAEGVLAVVLQGYMVHAL